MDEFKTLLFGTLASIAVIGIIATNTIVGVGERGVRVTLGRVAPVSLSEGIYFKLPIIQQIVKYDIKTKKSNIATTVFTKDIQQARLVYVINYNVQPENVSKLHKQVGKAYKETILTPIVEGTVKNVIGKWNASDLIANRAKATTDILAQLQSQLDDNYITVTDFNITDIDYSDSFEKAIEGKVTAEQDALKAKNQTARVAEEAKQKVISAEAEAKSMAIRAHALSQNKNLVEYEAVQKWDGKLPQYNMGNSIPFINLK